jgi:hypothetical protein
VLLAYDVILEPSKPSDAMQHWQGLVTHFTDRANHTVQKDSLLISCGAGTHRYKHIDHQQEFRCGNVFTSCPGSTLQHSHKTKNHFITERLTLHVFDSQAAVHIPEELHSRQYSLFKGSQPLRKAQNSAPCQFSTKYLQFSGRTS